MTGRSEQIGNSGENKVPAEEVIGRVAELIATWDFDVLSPGHSFHVATSIVHWTMETFGQCDAKGEFFLFPDSDGFTGEDLPESLKHLVMRAAGERIYLAGENKVRLQSQHIYVEDQPVIPEWERIYAEQPTFKDIVAYIRSQPEILEGITVRKIKTVPQVSMEYRPYFSFGWGLQFLVNPYGVKAVPFGDSGKTSDAFDYAVNANQNEAQLARTACQLSVLAARHSGLGRRTLPADAFDHLLNRLNGIEQIPICAGNFQPDQGSSMIDLVIEVLNREEEQ